MKKNKSKKIQSGSLGALPILVGLTGAVLAAGHGKDMFTKYKKFRVGKAVERLKNDSVVKHIKDIKLVRGASPSKGSGVLSKEILEAERAAKNRRVLSAAGKKSKHQPIVPPKPAPKPASVINFEEAKKRHLEKLSTVVSEDCFMNNFWSGFEKRSSGWGTAAELGGLGTLAIPSIQELRGKPMDEKTKAGLEVLGLGTLAAPYAGSVAKGAKNLAKKIL